MIIRNLEKNDVPVAHSLIQLNLKYILSQSYPPKYLAHYQERYDLDSIGEMQENSQMYAAHKKERMMGVVGLDDTTLFGLYVHPDFIGEGVGKSLADHIEEVARDQGVDELNLYSTIASHHFWEKRGYETMEKKFHPHWGRYVKMKKTIS